jgi:serine/threonine-protein kinase RsbW/stage II sporulation protein AB (anti-sigma F factor)
LAHPGWGNAGCIPTPGGSDLVPLRLELDAEPPSVRIARIAVARVAAAFGAEASDVALCVSEAVSNAVVHAYGDHGEGKVRVLAEIPDDRSLRVTVEDDGAGPAPRPESPGVGLGLPLIAALAARAEISSRSPSGTRLCMSFAIPSEESGRRSASG